ncbi:MAG: GTP-binding protein [Oscillospiraceae bacterium]|nr:GTP-binding protein [Oscillospiraceae bacterium]
MAKAKSKVNMPPDKLKKCRAIIHTAAMAAGAAGAIPIPVVDALPIGAAQLTMIVGLGKVFDLTINRGVAKSIAGIGTATVVGRTVASSLSKLVPIIGPVFSAATAIAITEGLGWLVADDFYRMSIGKEPEDIIDAADSITGLHDRIKR